MDSPPNADPAEEVQMIEGFISKHVSGMLVDSLGPSVCGAVNEAIKAGIPTLTWDSDCPDSERIAYVGSPNEKGGLCRWASLCKGCTGKRAAEHRYFDGNPWSLQPP